MAPDRPEGEGREAPPSGVKQRERPSDKALHREVLDKAGRRREVK